MKETRIIRFHQQGKQAALLLAVCFSLLISGCSHSSTNKDEIIAHLGTRPITINDLDTSAKFMGLGGKADQTPDQWSATERELILRETVQDFFLLQFAAKRKIGVSPGELQAFDAQHFTPASEHPENFTQRRVLLEKSEEALIPKKPVPASSILLFYHTHPEIFQIPRKALVDHIVVAREDEARTLHDALIKGGSFSKMARLESLGREASSGGRMKPFPEGTLPPPFDTVFSMKPGEISDVLTSPYGYHLFRLVKFLPEHHLSLSRTRSWIIKQVRQQQANEYLRKWLIRELQKQPIQISEKYREIFSYRFRYNDPVLSQKKRNIHRGDPQNPK
ncbi:MAG: peptidylprolyl isomerase [Leptospirales bacterium]